MFRWKLGTVALVPGLIVPERAPELHFAESEAIAKVVCGAGKFLQPCAALRFEQIQLLAAVRQAAETDPKQPDFSARLLQRD